ncbi:MAG: hypothetical protein QOJ31_945 [Gaiellales bacterium]|nr:hypothetical protein [Gaiellales bacterium]MDX6545361.1 hypothetical protein [Gaiellales bacterium]MDX6550261.1 hypothetical protein [Gaiellales bacterium]
MDHEPDRPRPPTSAVVLIMLGLAAGVLGVVLVATIGALGLLLFGPSLALFATGFAIARKGVPGA